MNDPKVLAKYGLTVDRLKEVFTAEAPEGQSRAKFKSRFSKGDQTGFADPFSEAFQLPEKPTNWDLQNYFRARLRMRIEEGIEKNLDVYDKYAAVDLALDTPLISNIQLPLAMLAQGYISMDTCADAIGGLSQEWRDRICEYKDEAKTQLLRVNIPRFWEISHNLALSLLTRRVAAIGTPIAQRHP